jgi:membrane associated rhomboid family serine protease
VLVLPIRRGSRTPSIPAATLALALASAAIFIFFGSHDRAALSAAASYYVDSGLAATELPQYHEYLTRSTDSDAYGRLQQLDHAIGRSVSQPSDPAGAIELMRGDRSFERDLEADKVITASDPGYAEWKRNRQHFDEMAHAAIGQQMSLSARTWREPWRLVTYLFLHPAAPLWFSCLLVLLLIGPFAEAVAGPALFALCYLGGGAFSGVVNVLLGSHPAVGDWGALAAVAGLLAATLGAHPVVARVIASRRKIVFPGIAALVIVIGVEALRWALGGRGATDVSADLSGLAFGAAFAGMFKLRDSRRARDLVTYAITALSAQSADAGAPKESALERQAREAATRLETKRATQLFKELVDLEPRRGEHLCGYLNVALMGPDETVLQDAALRLLWLRSKSHSDQMRKSFLLLTQPNVLKVLPIDEHLRLARRLVKLHEDAAALKVLDGILSDNHLRQLYGRQLADCLLGIYTGYVRRRLTTLADKIHSRLTQYFEAPDHLGGLPPATRPPTTVYTSSLRQPNTRLPPRSS